MSDDMVVDLQLDQEHIVEPSPTPLSPTSPPGGIEERIRLLKRVLARARQRPQWRQTRNSPQLACISAMEPHGGVNENQRKNVVGSVVVSRRGNSSAVEEMVGAERRGDCKWDASELEKALDLVSDVRVTNNDASANGNKPNFYDCNICNLMARDPILTCCGHLFCWCCFYLLPLVDSIAKECPVCYGEVTASGIMPIHGKGNNSQVMELESGVRIPPRPQARRVSSVTTTYPSFAEVYQLIMAYLHQTEGNSDVP